MCPAIAIIAFRQPRIKRENLGESLNSVEYFLIFQIVFRSWRKLKCSAGDSREV